MKTACDDAVCMRCIYGALFQGPCERVLCIKTVTFFAGGTGHPYFSTDTATVLRAIEIEADVILLAKSIDGVYDSDPKDNPDAKKFDEISIQEVIDRKLGVVDMTASILCMEQKVRCLYLD